MKLFAFIFNLTLLVLLPGAVAVTKGPEAGGVAFAAALIANNAIVAAGNPQSRACLGLLGANDSGVLSGTIVAQRTLEFLHVMFPLLTRIATNYSDEALLFKQQMIVNVPKALTAKAWDKATGYTPDPADVEQVGVMIDQHDHVSFGFNDQEVTATNRNLIDEHAVTSAYALGSKLFSYVFGNVTPANIKHENVIANADWNRRSIINQNAFLNLRGVSPLRRFGVVNSVAMAELLDDAQIVTSLNPVAGSTIDMSTGQVIKVHGVEIMEWPAMPGGAPNNYLNGFFGTSQALAVATCVPKDPATVNPGVPIPGNIELVTDPNTGMTLMVREHYDMKMGYHQVTLTWMYGASIGLPNTAERTVTQATGVGGTIVDTLG